MIACAKYLPWAWSVLALALGNATLPVEADSATNRVVIQSVVVDGKAVARNLSGKLSLGSSAKNVHFHFGAETTNLQAPLRFRCKLEGFDTSWHEGDGFMLLRLRFYDVSDNVIEQTEFRVAGESAGWNGSLNSTPLTHRRESHVVPPKASRVSIVISSAGPATTLGIYVVANLVVTETSSNKADKILLQPQFVPAQGDSGIASAPPAGWVRDGLRPSMAKIVQVGQDPAITAFALEDDSLTAHAEWRSLEQATPTIIPGQLLVLEWNEMYSIGEGQFEHVAYPSIPPGNYRFRVIGTDVNDGPNPIETAASIIVPQPIWERPWFWSVILVLVTGTIVGGFRYSLWQQMRQEMLELKNQQALESERLRIAHNIHDDLGARVTQITLVSAAALHDPALSEKTRSELNTIKRISRDLVTALYETVWAVNPEYDNLDALGNYLCQMVNQLCGPAQFRCRLHVPVLPLDVHVSSQIRHNLIMAVKEAVHNVIKHAQASEVVATVTFAQSSLDISISDDGCGFNPTDSRAGNGLANMRQRMKLIGGECSIESKAGQGTTIYFRLLLKNGARLSSEPALSEVLGEIGRDELPAPEHTADLKMNRRV